MSIDSSQNISSKKNTSLISIGNYSQRDYSQPHGQSYGLPRTLPPGNDNDETPLVDSHVNKHGLKALSRQLHFDFLITLVVVSLIAVVIRVYQYKGNLTRKQKNAFTTIITGLIVILGLSFFVRHLNKCSSQRSDSLPIINYRRPSSHWQRALKDGS